MRISDWSSDVCSSDLVAVGAVGFRTIEFARQALAGDAVALDVAHVRASGLTSLAPEPDQACLDDSAAIAKTGEPIAIRQQAPNARTAADPAAIEPAGSHPGLGAR